MTSTPPSGRLELRLPPVAVAEALETHAKVRTAHTGLTFDMPSTPGIPVRVCVPGRHGPAAVYFDQRVRHVDGRRERTRLASAMADGALTSMPCSPYLRTNLTQPRLNL